MTIVIINNFGQYTHRISRTLKYLKVENKLISNTTSLEDMEKLDINGMILSGGPSKERVGNCNKYIKKIDIPILGICLGHQILAEAYGGLTTSADLESYAQIELNILKEDDLFKGIGDKLKVWSSHKDEVVKLPNCFEILANSNKCDIEAIKHKEKPVFGIQFHPEVQHTPRGEEVFTNFNNICKKYQKQ